MTDDTDNSTLQSTRVVYEYCLERGIKPTRFVWTHKPTEQCGVLNPEDPITGITFEDQAYCEYCRDLQSRGATFGFHGASAGNNTREQTLSGIERFECVMGYAPQLFISHMRNAENIYWGADRYANPVLRSVARMLVIRATYHGNDENSPYFWADICRERIRYIRLYRTRSLNVLKKNPGMPFHDTRFPAVRYWYSASGQDIDLLNRLTPARLNRISEEDGLILHYAHSAQFVDDPNAEYPNLLEPACRGFDLIGSRDDVWCAGVNEVLDRLLLIKNLVITERRHAVIISNPLDTEIESVQVHSGGLPLYTLEGQVLSPDSRGVICLNRIPPSSTLTLYRSRELADIGDTSYCSHAEQRVMMIEEGRRLIWQKIQCLLGRDRSGHNMTKDIKN